MRNLAKQIMTLITIGIILSFVVQVRSEASVQTSVSSTLVYVCTGTGGDYPCDTDPYGPISYEDDYIPQVLANEWPPAASSEALKAGAIAIRTFGWRYSPCGSLWD